VLREHIGDEPQAFILVSALGLGDTHFIAASCAAFRSRHCGPGDRIVLVVKQSHRDLAEMFPSIDRIVPVPDRELVGYMAEAVRQPPGVLQRNVPYFAHPHTVQIHPHQAARDRVTDAAMYALILNLARDAPLALPAISDAVRAAARAIARRFGVIEGRTVLLVPVANSWAPPPEAFWSALTQRLLAAGWQVLINDPAWPLRCTLPLAELCGWVIGTQCGLMQVMVGSEITSRKTLLNSRVNVPGQPPLDPFPFCRMRNVFGRQYDIEEFVVDPTRFDDVVEAIATGRNARGELPDPRPATFVEAPISPGNLVDRWAALSVEQFKQPDQAHRHAQEIGELAPLSAALTRRHPRVAELAAALLTTHGAAWDANAQLAAALPTDAPTNRRLDPGNPEALARAEACLEAAAAVRRTTLERTRLIDEIDALCRIEAAGATTG
jgi:hypothetical protein